MVRALLVTVGLAVPLPWRFQPVPLVPNPVTVSGWTAPSDRVALVARFTGPVPSEAGPAEVTLAPVWTLVLVGVFAPDRFSTVPDPETTSGPPPIEPA